MQESKNVEPKFTSEDFNTVIHKAQETYFSWNKEFYCPYFQESIRITRSGWKHILIEKRPRHQKYWRAKNFEHIPRIIKKTTTVQKQTIRHLPAGKVSFWSFVSIESGNTLEVVIRQIENQPKHFYSLVYKGLSPQVIK